MLMGNRRRLLMLGFVAWAGLGPASARETTIPVQLVSPPEGATLRGGATAELEWRALGSFARLRGVEEWEAFLSLDGGSTYPIRITPHLDRDLRHVRWQVPGIPTSEARLLLRFGDERDESFLELPQRFAIAPAPEMRWAFTLASVAPAAGEPALPGHAGVVAWVEGSRHGGSLRQRVAPQRPSLRSALGLTELHPEPAILVRDAPLPQPVAAPRASGRLPITSRGSLLGGPTRARPRSSDILLLTQRQNE
jgi:hypothetical protein